MNALDPLAPDAAKTLRVSFGGPVISAGGYVLVTAERAIVEGRTDEVA